MEPLDLTRRPPRPARARVCGAIMLPRTIDKLRAEIPGGTMGAYLNHDRGFSAFAVRRLGLDMDELREVVRTAPDDAAVEAWLRPQLDAATVEAVNAKLESFVLSRMSDDDRALAVQRHPVLAERPEINCILDMLDAEDERVFGANRPD